MSYLVTCLTMESARAPTTRWWDNSPASCAGWSKQASSSIWTLAVRNSLFRSAALAETRFA